MIQQDTGGMNLDVGDTENLGQETGIGREEIEIVLHRVSA